MALFGKKTPAGTIDVVPSGGGERKEGARVTGVSHVLQNPRITEKATMHGAIGVYTFDVSVNATKRSVKEAVRAAYNVTPRSVRMVTIPSKTKRNARTGKPGIKSGGKKAYVFLKKGETLNIM